MDREIYNPVADTFYKDPSGAKELSPEQRKAVSEAELRRQIRSKERHEELKIGEKAAWDNYEDQLGVIQNSRREKEWKEEHEKEQRRKAREEEEKLIEKENAIERAKERYNEKGFFYRMFHKKVDYFKNGLGYHDTNDMTVSQIDNLYTGGKGR